MDKYILNITFSVEKEVLTEWKQWVVNELLPLFAAEEGFSSPQIARIVPYEQGLDDSFSVQHQVDGNQALMHWNTSLARKVQNSVADTFGQKVLFFPTLLELWHL